jgi:MFS superfamily sulfate permease-like transporter
LESYQNNIFYVSCFQKLQLILKCVIGDNVVLNKVVQFISVSRNALVVIFSTVLAASLGDESKWFDTVGKIEPGLPSIKLPPFTIYDVSTNITHSFLNILEEDGSAVIVMPLLAVMEHITIAKAFAGDQTLDPNQEMISIGVSNVVGSFFR